MSKIKHLLIIVGCVIGVWFSGGEVSAQRANHRTYKTGADVNASLNTEAVPKGTGDTGVSDTGEGGSGSGAEAEAVAKDDPVLPVPPAPGVSTEPERKGDAGSTDAVPDSGDSALAPPPAAAPLETTGETSASAKVAVPMKRTEPEEVAANKSTEAISPKKEEKTSDWVPATDKEGIFFLSVPIVAYWRTDKGMDLFTEKAALLNVGANAEVTLATIHKKWRISLAGTWLAERAESTKVLGGRFHTTWAADMFVLGAKLRYSLLPWLSPHLRLYGGVETTFAKMKEPGAKYTSPRDYGAAVGGAVGATVHTRPYKRNTPHDRFPVPSFGLLFETGYEYRAPVTLRFVDADTSPYAIDTELFSAGKLDRKSPFVRLDAFIRF